MMNLKHEHLILRELIALLECSKRLREKYPNPHLLLINVSK